MRRSRRARASKHGPTDLYHADEPPDLYGGDVALSLAAQALTHQDFDHAERCLKLAERHYRALAMLLKLRPDAFDWMEDMRREEAAEWADERRSG